MEAVKDRIRESAFRAFAQKGFKAVTMEQISKELGISKKTLYNYFSSKEELAEEFLKDFFQRLREVSDRAAAEEEDPQKRLWIKLNTVKEEYLKINPLFFEDIQKYAPSVWATYGRLRED
ncbi:MAG: TetR/AcrR family transcriptional regulator, partial [Desulfatiglandales bacterium]